MGTQEHVSRRRVIEEAQHATSVIRGLDARLTSVISKVMDLHREVLDLKLWRDASADRERVLRSSFRVRLRWLFTGLIR